MTGEINTGRLLLRPLLPEDAEDVFEWAGDPVVNRFMPYPVYTKVEDVRAWIRSIREDHHEFGFVLKNSGKVIGSGSIQFDTGLQAYAFGYNVNRAFWGNGYASEAARAMIGWAWHELGARDFAAVHAVDNPASGRVIQKCGLTVSGDATYAKIDGSETFRAICLRAHFEDDPSRQWK